MTRLGLDPFDEMQDMRAEHNLETGDNLSLDEWIKLTNTRTTHGQRADVVSVAPGFPLRVTVIHGRAAHDAGHDGRAARPQSTGRAA